jgi:cytochrome c553
MAVYSAVSPVPTNSAESATLVPVGRLFASNCAQCHGTDGQSGSISQLAGMKAVDMFNKMKDQQTHNSIMGAQARGYTDAEIRAIAAYFATLKKK